MPRPSESRLLSYDRTFPNGAGSGIPEKLFMYGLLRMIKPKRVLEIGVSRGHMTAWLALALEQNGKGRLTSVDNWSRNHGGEATNHGYALQRLKANDLQKFVDFVASDSYEYLKNCEENSFDVVWVDGDHSYEGAKRDIEEALRVASTLVGVHDTNQQYDGPKNAIEDLQGRSMGCWIKGGRGIWVRNLS
jgi:predicted O-methyltransferase YrrM